MTTDDFPPEEPETLEGWRDAAKLRVLMSEELALALGADRVEWGEPDADGFYTPTLYRDTQPTTIDDALATARRFIEDAKAPHGRDR